MAENVEKTNSGVKKKGRWKDVAEFSKEVEEAVKDSADEESVKDFKDWRPKEEEAENDMKEKTVEKAVAEQNIESEGAKDLKDASGKAVKATKKVAKGENPAPEIKASGTAAKPIAAKMLKLFRNLESLIYSNIILRGNRYYLDTEEISADMKSKRTGEYELDVNANTEKSRKRLKEKFEDAE